MCRHFNMIQRLKNYVNFGYKDSYRIQIQCFHSILNWSDCITKSLSTNVYFFFLPARNNFTVDNVVLVEARIMCMSTCVCTCVCMCVERRVKGIGVSISRVSTFKDLFSSDYVLCSHVDRNNQGITTVVSVILQHLCHLPEVRRCTSGRGGTDAKFSVQIQQKLHTVVSEYLEATWISQIIKVLFGLKTHPPLIF